MFKKFVCFLLLLSLLVSPLSSKHLTVYAASTTNYPEVINELLSSDSVSDMDAVIQAALLYKDADFAETGIRTSVDDNGRLTITQLIPSSDAARLASEETEIATSTIMVLSESGDEIYYSDYDTDYEGDNTSAVYAVLTTYYSLKQKSLLHELQVRVTKTTTRFTYSGSSTASNLYQTYHGEQPALEVDENSRSSTTVAPTSNTTYSFYVSGTWFQLKMGSITTNAYYSVNGRAYELENFVNLAQTEWVEIIS